MVAFRLSAGLVIVYLLRVGEMVLSPFCASYSFIYLYFFFVSCFECAIFCTAKKENRLFSLNSQLMVCFLYKQQFCMLLILFVRNEMKFLYLAEHKLMWRVYVPVCVCVGRDSDMLETVNDVILVAEAS